MDPQFVYACDRAIFVYATALQLGFRFETDGDKRLWLEWPPDLPPVVLNPMKRAIEQNLPFVIALVNEGCGLEEGEAPAEPPRMH